MFKEMVLQAWHSLSDPEPENSLRVRMDFMLFTGLDMLEEFPDETTHCRFRNKC
jgi:transposase, IS5 family